jgi:hypothetical protein
MRGIMRRDAEAEIGDFSEWPFGSIHRSIFLGCDRYYYWKEDVVISR